MLVGCGVVWCVVWLGDRVLSHVAQPVPVWVVQVWWCVWLPLRCCVLCSVVQRYMRYMGDTFVIKCG